MSLLAFPAVLRAAETFSDSIAPQQQQQKTRTLSGTVLDAVTNEPVIGAAVQVRGRQGGEITDLDGMFTINVPSGAVITVTSLGYRSQSLNVGNRDNIRILLEPDSEVSRMWLSPRSEWDRKRRASWEPCSWCGLSP